MFKKKKSRERETERDREGERQREGKAVRIKRWGNVYAVRFVSRCLYAAAHIPFLVRDRRCEAAGAV